jgi:hypothetical protein
MSEMTAMADPSRKTDVPRPPIKVPQFPPPHLLIWPGHPAGSAIARLRRAYRLCWVRSFRPRHWRGLVIGWLAWPLVAIGLSLHATRRFGRRFAAEKGVGIPRQFLTQLRISIVHRLVPKYYYIFELQRPGAAARAAEYVTRTETKSGIYRALKQRADRSKIVRINDKLVFSRFFGGHALRVVPVLAAFRDGARVDGVGDRSAAPQGDLFVKPIEGRGGSGTEAWRMQPDGRYADTHGKQLDLPALLAHVAGLSAKATYLVQPRLVNHPAIADLTPGALSTVRLLTVLDEAGEPEAVNAAFRMAISAESPVDNFHAGGIAAAVHMETGRLGAASGLGLGGDFSWHDVHPVTGARITDRLLPDWEQAKALAIAAHRLIAPRVLVGWDIGFLPDGPCLVEGNVGPDADIHQRVEQRPLGNARLGTLLAFHLERRLGLSAGGR